MSTKAGDVIIWRKAGISICEVAVRKWGQRRGSRSTTRCCHAGHRYGIGDAENDLVFLRRCGLAVAVSNALPTVKEIAHVVTIGARGAGVAELIDRWLGGEWAA